ncbi:MAG: adenine-specific methyltransferase EcoRI family protein [Clostridia bacterium]|nr:adenine-specific methyltransferase EcoRI family protein [Clostridia bacterium]
MAGNSNLHKAIVNKKDEFYTQLVDIELELKHYRKHFLGKTVFCNCDDPYESNFFKYFAMNFNFLGLKKLVATCYMGSPVVGEQFEQLSLFDILPSEENTPKRFPYKIEITEVIDINGDGAVDLTDVEYLLRNKNNVLTLLDGDGDFRSPECIEILKQADIVVTNPPFSLFREYIAQLVEYDKKFLVIGNQNAITYKEIFPLIKDNKLWLGVSMNGSNRYFQVPDDYPLTEKTGKIVDGKKYAFVKSVVWFTNLETPKRRVKIELYKKYTPEEYPKYDNYNAINIDKVSEIPEDYYGEMGVPVTFLHKYNPEQFEIIGCADYTGKYGSDEIGVSRIGEQWMEKYRKQGGRGHYTANMTSLVYYDNDGNACNTFKRILIRRKQ